MSVTARLLIIGLVSVAAPGAQALPSGSEMVICGGETDVATVDRYFADLREALMKSAPKTRFNAFVDTPFGIRSRPGRTLYFNAKDVGSITPGRISIREWREITRRGAQSLQNAGWRGCFLDNGKVWFQASKERGFRLTLISRDMPWVIPEKGDVLP